MSERLHRPDHKLRTWRIATAGLFTVCLSSAGIAVAGQVASMQWRHEAEMENGNAAAPSNAAAEIAEEVRNGALLASLSTLIIGGQALGMMGLAAAGENRLRTSFAPAPRPPLPKAP